jgi:3-phenylpropionate/trans-cinnamate dioxygenase ferredoxin subunit
MAHIISTDGFIRFSTYARINGPSCAKDRRPLIVSSAAGRYEHERTGEIVCCPWHQWEFDMKTSRIVVDPAMRKK